MKPNFRVRRAILRERGFIWNYSDFRLLCYTYPYVFLHCEIIKRDENTVVPISERGMMTLVASIDNF